MAHEGKVRLYYLDKFPDASKEIIDELVLIRGNEDRLVRDLNRLVNDRDHAWSMLSKLDAWLNKNMPGVDRKTYQHPVDAALHVLELVFNSVPSMWRAFMAVTQPIATWVNVKGGMNEPDLRHASNGNGDRSPGVVAEESSATVQEGQAQCGEADRAGVGPDLQGGGVQ